MSLKKHEQTAGRAMGVLGCARISKRALIDPLKKLTGWRLAAVASRDHGRAQHYAETHGIPLATASYQALLEREEIEAVYIPLTNRHHCEWAVKAARAGKHILVEKPICLDRHEMAEIDAAVTAGGIYAQEAVMVAHHPWQAALASMVSDAVYGKLSTVETTMTMALGDKADYRLSAARGGGVFFDFAPYWLQFLQALLPDQVSAPPAVESRADFAGPNGNDLNFHAHLRLPHGVDAYFDASFQKPFQAAHLLRFERATVHVRNFFAPAMGHHKLKVEVRDESSGVLEKRAFEARNYYEDQLLHFTRQIESWPTRRESTGIRLSAHRVALLEDIYSAARSRATPTYTTSEKPSSSGPLKLYHDPRKT